MTSLLEADLEFVFTDEIRAVKFDENVTHGLTDCMSSVDFVVEYADKLLLIEVKDPDHPQAAASAVKNWEDELESGRLIRERLVPKCRDSYLYLLSANRFDLSKPVYYIVILEYHGLREPEFFALKDQLRKSIPIPNRSIWPKPFISNCHVMNSEMVNNFRDIGFRIIRKSLATHVS